MGQKSPHTLILIRPLKFISIWRNFRGLNIALLTKVDHKKPHNSSGRTTLLQIQLYPVLFVLLATDYLVTTVFPDWTRRTANKYEAISKRVLSTLRLTWPYSISSVVTVGLLSNSEV